MTTILPASADMFDATRVHRAAERQAIIDEATAAAAAKIAAEGYEFATGALGGQIAAERTIFGGVAVYSLSSGELNASTMLSKAQARGLRDYLNSIDIEG